VRTVVKPVYYCEHCKRHRMTAAAILKHEPRCIYNPLRDVCGWHADMKPLAPADLVAVFIDTLDIEWLRKQTDGCPACMLAVIVQARRHGLDDEDAWDFDYRAECAKYRESERYEDAVAW
jgi:hypothetical protein